MQSFLLKPRAACSTTCSVHSGSVRHKRASVSCSSVKSTTSCRTTAAVVPAPLHQHAVSSSSGARRRNRSCRLIQVGAAVESSTQTETESSPTRLTGQEAAAWQAAAAELAAGVEGFDTDTQQRLLQRAFGWGKTSPFWRGSKVEEVPQPGQVQSVLGYLQSLGVTGPNLAKVVKTFPEVLGCSISDQLEVSVKKLQADWKLQGDVLMRAVVRQPQVLGYNVDCEGSCVGECNRCWARF